jgi:Ulp1 family protease
VTIVKHTQHLQIARGFSLRCANIADSNAFDKWRKNWSAYKNSGHDLVHLQALEFERNTTCAPFRVSSKEMVQLGHGRWLVTEILWMYMYLLEKHFLDIHFSHANIVHIHNNKLKSLEKQFGQHDTIIFCCNVNDNHWIAIKLEKRRRRITICDSLHGKNEDSFAQIQKLANKIGISGQLEHILVKVPHQTNTNDCGVTTCLFMLCMAHNVENELTYDDSKFVSRHFRLRLFADIVKKKVTPLQDI